MEAIALKRIDDVAVMEALMPGSTDQGRRQAAAAAHRHLDQGPDPGRRLPARRMLPPDPGRPDRRPEARGRGDRGPRDRLRQPRRRRRRRLGRSRLGRPVGRRRRAAVRRHQERARLAGGRSPASSAATAPTSSRWTRPRATARFHTFHLDIEVHDVQHLMRILAALRADRRGLDGGAALGPIAPRPGKSRRRNRRCRDCRPGRRRSSTTLLIAPALGAKSALRRMNWLLGMVVPRLTRAIGIDQMLAIDEVGEEIMAAQRLDRAAIDIAAGHRIALARPAAVQIFGDRRHQAGDRRAVEDRRALAASASRNWRRRRSGRIRSISSRAPWPTSPIQRFWVSGSKLSRNGLRRPIGPDFGPAAARRERIAGGDRIVAQRIGREGVGARDRSAASCRAGRWCSARCCWDRRRRRRRRAPA